MSSLGIYFGPKRISISESKGRKFINHTYIPHSTVSIGEGGLEEKVPVESKILEIIALFKDELRRNKIKAEEAVISLSGKDLIMRSFEIPVLPRDELESAINFEVKKYIPFKLEELIYSFQVEYDKSRHTNFVLFVGIKKELLSRYLAILNQLEIKVKSLEYSTFSILRFLKSINSLQSDKGIIGVFAMDISEKDEANFVVLENGFPLFSRDISLAEEKERAAKTEELDSYAQVEKLKTEIRVSLDYYRRKFPTKNIKKIFLLSNPEYRANLEAFMGECGTPAQFVDIDRSMDSSIYYSLSLIKAFGASLFKTISSKLKLDLLAAREKQVKEKVVKLETVSLIKGFTLDYRIVLLGLLICTATYLFGIYRVQPFRKELNRIVAIRMQVSAVNPGASYEELGAINAEYKRKLNNLRDLINKQFFFTQILNVISEEIPKDLWLTGFSYSKTEEWKAELSLDGMVYNDGDSDKEIETANRFLSNLKKNPAFKKYFKEISITGLSRVQVEKLNVTRFSIICRS